MINWAEIVDSTIKTPVFPLREWEHGKGVGTESEAQAIENKGDCKPVPTVTPVPIVFEETRVWEDEKHNHSSLEEPAGVGFRGKSRRINRAVEPVPTCAALACPMGTVQAARICRPPTRPGIRCAGSLAVVARAARAGCFIGASTFPVARV